MLVGSSYLEKRNVDFALNFAYSVSLGVDPDTYSRVLEVCALLGADVPGEWTPALLELSFGRLSGHVERRLLCSLECVHRTLVTGRSLCAGQSDTSGVRRSGPVEPRREEHVGEGGDQ